MGRFEDAVADFSRAVDFGLDNGYVYCNRGIAYLHMKELDQAIADFDRVLAHDPKNIVIYSDRGLAYLGKKDYERALSDFDRALAIDPRFLAAYENRGSTIWKPSSVRCAISTGRKSWAGKGLSCTSTGAVPVLTGATTTVPLPTSAR
jgi:tetratricopeptide (TPR) repeat protein